MKATDYAYLAGFFDGEGCVYISKTSATTYTLYVMISQAKGDVLGWLHDEFGGSLTHKRHSVTNERKYWCWKISGAIAEDFLHRIYPYVIQKSKEIDVAFRLCEHKRAYSLKSLAGLKQQGTIERVLREREQMKQEISGLKKISQEITE